MSEPVESGHTRTPDGEPATSLGEALRQARESKHMSVETVARDLKLNAKYIESLEANRFDELPADPYIRVYLRSLARYMLLDVDTVLKKYQLARGISPVAPVHETSTKIDVSKVESDKAYGPWIVICVVIALLAGISFIASKKGWTGSQQKSAPAMTPSTSTIDSSGAPNDTARDTTSDDSSGAESAPVQPPIENDTILDSSTIVHDTAPPMGKRLSMVVRAAKDSSWVQVFSDGQSWKNTLRRGSYKSFTAKDSFNVHVGKCPALEFTVNGKLIKPFSDSGVVVFKIDRAGAITKWSLAKYQAIFAKRL